jgi:excisionase family DNA binding protein
VTNGPVNRKEDHPVHEHRPRLTVTVVEAATLLGISRTLAYELVARGELPHLRLSRRILIPRRALDELLDGGSDRPA